MSDVEIAVGVFVVTYALVISEKVHKTTIALAGGMAVVGFKILSGHEAFEAINLEVIFLLTGMMIIANTMASTGVFGWMAIRAAKAGNGDPLRVTILLCAITAVGSAFLDNVTTVVLIAPVTLVVADMLGMKAVPLLIAEVLASNIGGTATLIGDPPNILIATHADIDFVTFMLNVGPASILSLIAFLFALRWLMRGQIEGSPDAADNVMRMDDTQLITDMRMLKISGGVLALVVVGFLLQGVTGYDPAIVALTGAALLLLITREDPHDSLREVEWSTLFFFIGLFILVGSLEKVGVLEDIGMWADDVTGGSEVAASMLILWMSAVLSGFVDNIPYTATMLTVVDEMNAGQPDPTSNLLWWSLAIGADMGGNLTIVAASANVLVANLATRNGHKITFMEFFRYGAVTTVGTILISTAYLWARYLAL